MNKINILRRAFYKLLLLFWTPAVWAAPAVQIDAGMDLRWFDWREHQGSKQLLMEFGPAAGVTGQLTLDWDKWFIQGSGTLGAGLTRYDGHLQTTGGGLGSPYSAWAYETFLDTAVHSGWKEENWNVYAGAMARVWDRFINGSATVSSAQERYFWLLALAGGEYVWWQDKGWQASLVLEAGLPVISREKIFSEFFGDFHLRPGEGRYARIAVPLRTESMEWQPYFQFQDTKTSNVVSRLGSDGNMYLIHQPASIRRELGLSIMWRFGRSGSL